MKAGTNSFKPLRPLSAEQRHILENMKAEISSVNVSAVSFELFETLALRPFFDRCDLLFFMEREFSSLYAGKRSFYDLRREAEERAVKKAKETAAVTLVDIYKELEKISKISPSSRERLMKRECELEEYFCFARQCGAELFRTAAELGKKVIVTAETYLPRKTVEEILRRSGFAGWDKLCITGESGLPKTRLFEQICREMEIQPHTLLHFGSSFESDAEAPVNQGVRPVFITSCRDRLVKSGRLCGFIQKELIYDFCSEKCLALRCALGLYAAYAFDYPQNKLAQSDFCGDSYMLGFMVLGPLSLYKDLVVSDETELKILGALSRNKAMTDGRTDFIRMFGIHFGSNLEKYGTEGCSLPFRFFFSHGAIGDRMSVQPFISADVMEKWSGTVTEPEIVQVFLGRTRKTAVSRLADRLFPPGTQIRTYVDGILAKMH